MLLLQNKFQIILKKIILRIHNSFVQEIYSQEGEDLILDRFFQKDYGIYVDIGAHHPKRFSNTYMLYKKGWKGINIDPIPGSKKLFDKYRPRDINLEIGISDSFDKLIYYQFNEKALNTFDKNEAELKDGMNNGQYFIVNKSTVEMFPLSFILSKNLSNNNIDFLTIDVEGLELQVLKSNDWDLFRPKLILVEELRSSITNILKSSNINIFLKNKSYELIYRTYNTSFYISK